MIAKAVQHNFTRHFKYFRIGAIYSALTLLNKTPPSYRVMHSSLTVGAILIYMLNALNYRPAEGRRETELTQTCCWNLYPDDTDSDVVDSDEDEDPVPVMLDFGLYFISGVHLRKEKALQMGRGDTVSMDSIASLYKVHNDLDLQIAFNPKTSHAHPDRRNRNRVQNHREIPADLHLVASNEELMAQDTLHPNLGTRAHIEHQEEALDIQVRLEDHMDEDETVQEESVNDVISRIWWRFPYDLFENAPDCRSNQQGSHLLLSEQQRSEATIEVFRDTDLSALFSRVVVKKVGAHNWENLEFKRYFPEKGYRPPTRLQNFPRMRYFQEWNTLMDTLSQDNADIVRASVWKIFQTFKWLPLTDADRVWNTRRVKKPAKEWIHLPHDDNKPVVQIALNAELVKNARSIQLSVGAPVSNSGEESPTLMDIDQN